MNIYWQDSEEFWFHGGQYIIEIELEDGYQEIIVPIECPSDSDNYERHKEEAKILAEKIALLLTKNN